MVCSLGDHRDPKIGQPKSVMFKQLASLSELQSSHFEAVVKQVNEAAFRSDDLQEYITYSRIWEYPWIWSQLEPLKDCRVKVLDVGTERSPFPWFLARQGFDVTVSDMTAKYWKVWQRVSRQLGANVHKRILDAQDLALPTGSLDVYLSVSVIEHVPNKQRALAEAARVLRPGGLLIMTFDICEPEMEMTFPEWNGQALTMCEFDDLFRNSRWFESGLADLPWNTEDISNYLSWHRTTATWHNYVTGAAVVRRNDKLWVEPDWKDYLRVSKGKLNAALSVANFYLRRNQRIVRPIKSAARILLSSLTSPRTALLVGEPFFWLLGMRAKKRVAKLRKAKRVLVVRLDEIGDVVMTTPLLRELRRNLPDAWITLVVKPAVYNLVELCPYVNEVLAYDCKTSGRFAEQRRHWRALRLGWKNLWRRRFDLAILPRWDADYYHGSFLTYFSGAPWRVGYSTNVSESKQRLNSGLDCLLSHKLEDSDPKHEVEHNLDVIRFLGGSVQEEQLELWLGEDDETFAEQILKSNRINPTDLLIAFGVGAGSKRRMWPIDNFVETGRWLREEYNARIIAIGGRGEESLGQEIQQELDKMALNTTGQTTLRQTAALLKRCNLYVGNDAGPMHLAAAESVPVVEISCHPIHGSAVHANSPKRFGPWGVPHLVLQPEKPLAPCSDGCNATEAHCILNVSVAQVKEAIEKIMKQKDIRLSTGIPNK